jgi:hypothetical protein
MRIGMLVSAATLALTLVGAAHAQTTDIKKYATLVDSNGSKIAQIDRVNTGAGGAVESVSVIYNMKYVTIPANTLSSKDGKVVTSLTKAQVSELGK